MAEKALAIFNRRLASEYACRENVKLSEEDFVVAEKGEADCECDHSGRRSLSEGV